MPSLEPELVWGLFARLIGLVYLVAFLSLSRDVLPIAGRAGISPLAPQLAAIARDYRRPTRWLRFPTLFWIHSSDRALLVGTYAGAGCALLVVLGVASWPALLLCWALYLSYDLAMDLLYPWDSVLLEAGFLALFLPSLLPLPELAAVAGPAPPIAWAYRWLLFRVVFGFGKYKFFGPGTLHLDYLKSFLISQPLSTPIAVRAARLPRWVFALALATLFVIEVPTPFLVFGPPSLRLIAASAIGALMIGIQLSGNFGFFNLVVLALCVPLLDTESSLWVAESLEHPLALAYACFLFGAGLLSLPFNSWVGQAWTYWPALARLPGIGWIVAALRALAPYRLVHPFGVFSPESGPPLKWVPVVEGSRDGTSWEAYRFRHMPSASDSPAVFVAPFMPRFDHALIYDALGISLTNFVGSVFGVQNPYRFSRSGWMERLAQRLLEGRPAVRALFAHDPFGEEPPIAIRVRLKSVERAPDDTQWVVRDVGTHLPEQRRDASVFERWLPVPELFHWDDESSRRQSAGWRARMAREEDPQEVTRLFESVVATVARVGAGRWQGLDDAVRTLARIPQAERDSLEALAARLAWRLARRLEAHSRLSWFDLGLLAYAAIGRGQAFYEDALEHPERALLDLGEPTVGEGLRLWAALRPNVLAFQARKARLRELTIRGAARKPPAVVPGFFAHLGALARYLPDDTEAGVRYARGPRGWVVEGAPQPTGSEL